MALRASIGLGFTCLALAACTHDESPTPGGTGARPYNDVSTQLAAAEWKAVIDDWYVDGVLDSPHRCVAVKEAVKQLPTRDYSRAYRDLRRIEQQACA